MKYSIERGRICVSLTGRDKGRLYVITGMAEKDYVFLADGRTRKISNPKKKNAKHIRTTSYIYEGNLDGDAGQETDAGIRKILKDNTDRIE